MIRRRSLLATPALVLPAGLATSVAGSGSARAQAAWPTQPVRLVVPFAAGGPTDIPARLIADELNKALPQRTVVENRTGAGVVVGSDAVSKAPKDGQTLLYTTVAHAALRAIFPRLPFDPVADLTPVVLTGTIPLVLVVNKDLPVNSAQELIALIKANPNKYDYASTGNGAVVHLGTELFLRQAGRLRASHVPYRGSAAALPDLLNGTVAMMFDVANNILPFATRGEVKPLAVSSSERLPQLPNVPTLAEIGVQGAETYTWHMIFAPAGTPAPTILTINQAVNRVMAMDGVKQRLADLTMTTRSDTTPETAKKWLDDEIAKWEPLIREAGIRAD